LPNLLNWKQFIGVACLSGVGFTMSIFVTKLSFPKSHASTDNAILVIMIASLIASIVGLIFLHFSLGKDLKKIRQN
ncbi:MAG TPA: Na+/H+ antiporter NhaA, partial [Arachidicoccus soli]|nr:Na+/H+ antiporter NhaA [Arachidicoccus soli]